MRVVQAQKFGRDHFLRVLAVILLTSSFVGCLTQPNNNGEFSVRGVKEFENQARIIARDWEPDAFLSSVHVNIQPNIYTSSSPMADLLQFEFRSPRNNTQLLVVTFLGDGMPSTDKLFTVNQGNWVPIDSNEWSLDSIDAWRIAQKEIVKADTRSMRESAILVLRRANPPRTGRLLWYVSYGQSSSAQIWIDAQTGEVVNRR